MALVWVALVGFALILFVAIAGDTAHVYLCGNQLQNAADASALAGVWEVREEAPLAHNRAIAVAAENRAGQMTVQLASNAGNAAGGDVVIGVYDSGADTFTPTFTQPNAVQVVARRTSGSPAGPLPLIFGPMAGVTNSNVSRTAIAVIGGPSVEAGLILLNRHAPGTAALTGTGSNVKINIPNGAIQINSDHADGVSWTGHPTIVAEAMYIGSNQPDAEDLLVGGELGVNSPPVEDPLGGLPPPPKPAPANPNANPLQPGYYNNNWPNRSVTLSPGIYWIDGGINMSGNRTINATAGVMLFFNTGSIRMGGNTGLTINPPTSGTYAGISIYQRRGNTAQAELQGTPGAVSTGTFYFPSARLEIAGNPTSFASQVIADTLHIQGNGQLNINYDGRNPVQGHRIWLAR
jgi:hypothetical protein